MDSILLFIRYISSAFNYSLSKAQLNHKIEVIIELNDSLGNIEIVKNDQKRLYNADV